MLRIGGISINGKDVWVVGVGMREGLEEEVWKMEVVEEAGIGDDLDNGKWERGRIRDDIIWSKWLWEK